MLDRDTLIRECGIDRSVFDAAAKPHRPEAPKARKLPPDAEVARLYQELGSVVAVADHLGLHRNRVAPVLWRCGAKPRGAPGPEPTGARQVWEMLAGGMSTVEIARRLGVTPQNVANQLRRARRHWGDPRRKDRGTD